MGFKGEEEGAFPHGGDRRREENVCGAQAAIVEAFPDGNPRRLENAKPPFVCTRNIMVEIRGVEPPDLLNAIRLLCADNKGAEATNTHLRGLPRKGLEPRTVTVSPVL